MNTGLWVVPVILDMVVVVNVVPSGSDVTLEGFGRGMRYAGAAYHIVSGRCGGIVGGF